VAGRGGAQPGRRWVRVLGRGEAVATGHALLDRGQQQPVQGDPVTLPERHDRRAHRKGEGQGQEHRHRDDGAGEVQPV